MRLFKLQIEVGGKFDVKDKKPKGEEVIDKCMAVMGVYTKNRLMRTAFCTKKGQTRPLLPPGGLGSSDSGPKADFSSLFGAADPQFLPARTIFYGNLVSYFGSMAIFDQPREIDLLSSERLELSGRKRKHEASVGSAADTLSRTTGLITGDPELETLIHGLGGIFPDWRVGSYGFDKSTLTLLYYTRSHDCEISKREHGGNHIYYKIRLDLHQSYYVQLCHNEACKRACTAEAQMERRKPIHGEYRTMIEVYFRSKNSINPLKFSPQFSTV